MRLIHGGDLLVNEQNRPPTRIGNKTSFCTSVRFVPGRSIIVDYHSPLLSSSPLYDRVTFGSVLFPPVFSSAAYTLTRVPWPVSHASLSAVDYRAGGGTNDRVFPVSKQKSHLTVIIIIIIVSVCGRRRRRLTCSRSHDDRHLCCTCPEGNHLLRCTTGYSPKDAAAAAAARKTSNRSFNVVTTICTP